METEIVYDLSDYALLHAADIIKNGGLVAFPTETVYGLGANALMPSAARKIYEAKGRPSDNPLIIHLACASDAEKYCETNEIFYKLASAFMPGPLTVILPKKKIIPHEVTGGLETVALRIPSDAVARRLIELSGVPIAAPSANISGRPSPTSAKHVIQDMQGRVDVILCGEDCDIGVESTIISLVSKVPIILRPGKVTIEELSSVCPNVCLSEAVLHQYKGKPQSPGMKYKHYAPIADVILLEGSYEKRLEFLNDKPECGILCYDEEKELLKMPCALSIGSINSPEQQAHILFSRLREFDEMKNIKKIYAPKPNDAGVGLAVLNRMIRAAGFSVIKL